MLPEVPAVSSAISAPAECPASPTLVNGTGAAAW